MLCSAAICCCIIRPSGIGDNWWQFAVLQQLLGTCFKSSQPQFPATSKLPRSQPSSVVHQHGIRCLKSVVTAGDLVGVT